MNSISIEVWALSRLHIYKVSLKKNDHSVKRMMESIRVYGFKVPVLATAAGDIIDGHLRLKAAAALGLAEVPVIVCDDWTPEQIQSFRLLVNRSANWAEWNWKAVAEELAQLSSQNYDLTLTGFDSREIAALLRRQEEPACSSAAQRTPEEAISRSGDVWELGPHRVQCGDATQREAVENLLQAAVPVLMITDPPYGVNYDPKWREQAGLGTPRQTGLVPNDDRVDWAEAFALFAGDVAYVWHAGLYAGVVASSLQQCGFEIRSQIIWAKQHFAMSRGHYHWQHEPCWYAVRAGASAGWTGGRKQSTVWEVSNLNPFGGGREADTVTGHGTQKPVELMRRPILNHTEAGALVYDPFLGSGTTLMAAEETGRVCYGIEIDAGYVDAIVQRWQKRSGQPAVRQGDGRSFDELQQERGGAQVEEVSFDVAA